MIKKCDCGGKYDYSISDITPIRDTNPPEVETEAICRNCQSYIVVTFKAYKAEIFDESMDEKSKKVVNI